MKQIQEIISLLESNIKKLYTSHEMSEILIRLYGCVHIALRMGTDILIIAPNQIFYLDKEGKTMYKFPEEVYETIHISHIEVFELMLSRDKVIANLFEIIEKSEQEVKLKIKNEK